MGARLTDRCGPGTSPSSRRCGPKTPGQGRAVTPHPRRGAGAVAICAALALAAVIAAGQPARADKFAPPAGCTAFLSVQSLGCSVAHYWRCEGAPAGTVWEARYDVDGAFSLSVYDREFQWLDSRYFDDGSRERLLDGAPDPASLTDLLRTGRDSYAFVVRETGPDGQRDIVHQGSDTLTGRKIVVDGTELLETEFTATAVDATSGEEVYAIAGRQYLLESERLFLLGTDRLNADGTEIETDSSPMRFFRPGDSGFGETRPRFGCEASEDIAFRPAPSGEPGR